MIQDYEKAKKLGEREVRNRIARGQYPYLTALEDMLPAEVMTNTQSLGLVEVPVGDIVGTRMKGRQNAFADNFMPLLEVNSEFANKWSNLYDSAMSEGIREPIVAYEYMRKFYVQEGNKRVSVTRFMEIDDVLASVTRIIPKRTNELDNRLYYEFMQFYEAVPLYDIAFTREGSYEKLAEACGQDLKHRWSSDAIRELKSNYYIFAKIFREKGGSNLQITAGDALLVYLTIYPMKTLSTEPVSVIRQQMDKIWNEIVLAGTGKNIDLVESPDETEVESTQNHGFWSILTRPTAYTAENPLHVAFLYDLAPAVSSWSYAHDLGRSILTERFHGAVVTETHYPCMTEEQVRGAIDEAAANGCKVIFTTSILHMPETQRSAIHYPDIQFLNCSINLTSSEVQTYYARMYEARFIMGALGAMMSENHKIAYRAFAPLYGAVADINAFAIGAGMIDPKVKVYLGWAGTGDDEDWKRMLWNEEINVISGLDTTRPDRETRRYGLFSVHNDKITNLAAPLWNWGRYYELLLRPIVENGEGARLGRSENSAMNYFWGMSAGVVDVVLSEHLPFYARKMMGRFHDAIMSGELNPFDGELHSQQGIVKGPKTPRLSEPEIISLNWLNDNVIGEIPKEDQMTALTRAAMAIGGVEPEENPSNANGGWHCGSSEAT